MVWRFRFEQRAGKDFAKLDKTTQARIVQFLKQRETRPPQDYSNALSGEFKGFWRIRVGDYRLIIQIDEETQMVSVYEVGHRKHIYRH